MKNGAKIRGKRAGNWKHLQNKGEDGEVGECRVIKEGGLHPFVGVDGILKRRDLVCWMEVEEKNDFCPPPW